MRATRLLPRIKLPVFKVVATCGLLVVGMLAWSIVAHSGQTVAATSLVACTPSGTTYGTDSFSASNTPSNPIVITSTATYHIWVRLQVPSTSANALLLNMDNATGNNCYNVDASSLTPNTWTWVDATAGLATLPTFSQGNHTLLVTGTQSGVSLDSIEFLNDGTCVPTGTGANCTTSTNTPPTVSINSPTSGSVSGTVNITATATATTSGATITSVQFQVDGANVGSPDTTAPYSYSWNTNSVSNGSHTITAVATDSNNLTTTSSGVTVTVNNTPTCGTGTLSPPTGLTKTSSTYTTVGLSWTAPSPTAGCTITGYKVFRNGSQVGTPTTASFSDSGLTASNTYSYTVEAVDSGPNTSVQSATLNAATTADNEAPTVPGNVNATAASASQVNLSWSASTDNPNPGGVGVKGYNIYRCTGASCTPSTSSPLNTTPVSGTTYNDTTVSASTSYGYVVTAVDNVGNESAPSTVVSATTQAPTCSGNPTTPGTPTKTSATVTTISFNWTASTASAGCTLSGYHIYRADVSATNPIATISSGTSYTDSALTPNTSYTYTVKAFDTSSHNSSGATAAIATPADTTAPTAPGSVTATAASSVQVNLTWGASTDNVGVTGYKIYRSDKGSTAIATVSGTTLNYSDTTVAASTSYTYQVSAIDGAGNESTKTSSNSVTTPAASGTAPSSAPGSAQAPTIATQSAVLTWTAPGGTVTGYHVYIDGILDSYNKDTFTSTGGTLNCLAPSVIYAVTIKAYNSGGEGPAASVSVHTQSGGYAGDFDCSGAVNGLDLSALATDWGQSNMQPFQGDSNGDTKVNAIDLSELATNWNK